MAVSTVMAMQAALAVGAIGSAQPDMLRDPFRQLDEVLPTPGVTRSASGAPGHEYWQQAADYDIDVRIDDEKQRLIGSERITYTNNSPDTLRYVWLQLDANIFAPDSDAARTSTAPGFDRVPYGALRRIMARQSFDGSVKLGKVQVNRKDAPYTVVDTMMRIDLPKPVGPGKKVKLDIDWSYAINESEEVGGRTGFEEFDDGNHIYEIAQWFPRMAPYDDVNGWQHKRFLGAGEFALEFGDYHVEITVPADFVVGATGVLKNANKVLSGEEKKRLERARSAKKPVFVVTPEEAKKNEAEGTKSTKTWVFEAKEVRDFAFAASRKFIWDAWGVKVGSDTVMAMSLYPNEGEPLWSKYSTHAIAHTLEVYSRYTFDYPYPVAYSVNGPVGGMEYPMICFNGPRPEEDGTYTKRTKYGLISVIIHEVGHNYFPMIVNSDEREWTWMDEGLNTFLQYLTEQEWEKDYPSRRGEPRKIVDYMSSDYQVPIMTSSDSLLQFGNNAYAKPATALNILRESILGRERFDFAFKEYARRWQFKRPMPADFFRTMEDASGEDLDWFWRGWFYTTAHTDIGIVSIEEFTVDTGDPNVEKARQKAERDERPTSLSQRRNEKLPKRIESYKELEDFYNEYDELDVTPQDEKKFKRLMKRLEPDEKKQLKNASRFYVVEFENVGGLVMPIVLEVKYADGSTEEVRIPAQIWRKNGKRVRKLLVRDKDIAALTLDPHLETADIDLSNNHFPPKIQKSRFKLFKHRDRANPMQKAGLGEGEKEEEGDTDGEENER